MLDRWPQALSLMGSQMDSGRSLGSGGPERALSSPFLTTWDAASGRGPYSPTSTLPWVGLDGHTVEDKPVHLPAGKGSSLKLGLQGRDEKKMGGKSWACIQPLPSGSFQLGKPSALKMRKQEKALNTNQEKIPLLHFLPLSGNARK